MPLQSFKGFATSDGFKNYHKKVLTTYTFPSGTSTFTTPRNVTNLTTVVGKGADGVSDSIGSFGLQFILFGRGGSYVNQPYADYSLLWNDANAYYTTLSSYIGKSVPSNLQLVVTDMEVSSDDTWQYNHFTIGSAGALLGGATITNVLLNDIRNPTPHSGNITSADIYRYGYEGWYVVPEWYNFGGSGDSTTGFNKTFAGGGYSGSTGYPASPTTFNDVAVTPNTIYTITNNGSLTIQYYT
jgi:hypothetical protein